MKQADIETGKFYVGGRSMALIRRIDDITGGHVHFLDCAGNHISPLETFARWAKEVVPSPEPHQLDQLVQGEVSAARLLVLTGRPPKQHKPFRPYRQVLYSAVAASQLATIRETGMPVGTHFYTVPVLAADALEVMHGNGVPAALVETPLTEDLRAMVTSAHYEWNHPKHQSIETLEWTNGVVLPGSLFTYHRPEGVIIDVSPDRPALEAMRRFLEPLWQDWQDRNLWRNELVTGKVSDGLCSMSTGFLLRYLDLPISTLKRGQFRIEPTFRHLPGFRDSETAGHTWIEVGGWIFDLTADQFGTRIPRALVARGDDDRYQAYEERHWFDWGNYQLMQELDEWLDLARSDSDLPSPRRILFGVD